MTDDAKPHRSYTAIDTGEGFPAGLMLGADAPSYWITYIRVADLAASTSKAKELGARALRERIVVPDQGAFSILADPTGAVFGLWEKSGD